MIRNTGKISMKVKKKINQMSDLELQLQAQKLNEEHSNHAPSAYERELYEELFRRGISYIK